MSLRVVQQLKQYRHDGTKWCFVFARNAKRKGQCRVIYCKRPARVEVRDRGNGLRTEVHRFCQTCECRLYRANHPAEDAYRIIRDRALRRGQIFAITFEQFCAIPRFDDYIRNRGRGRDELHLDRIKVGLGYVPGNLQVLTTAENLRKQREVDYSGKYVAGPF